MGGIYLVMTAASGFWFGAIVDHHKKKWAMQLSNVGMLVMFTIAFIFFLITPEKIFHNIASVHLWIFIVIILLGAVCGNIRNIALPTVTTLLVDADRRDKANGLAGTIFGFSFAISNVLSGVLLGFLGMYWVILSGIVLFILAIIHLAFIHIPENRIVHTDDQPKKIDIKGTIKVMASIPGLFALIFFTTFNNFLGGVYMALMDAYGLSLVSVQVWGTLWGVLSFGFILGGLLIAKKGLGKNPLLTLFQINIALWIISFLFPIQPSIVFLAIGMFLWMCLMPFAEAAEQTIIQKVVPPERQGRVFGFSQSVEQAASPVTAFFIGPIAQFIFIPFMTTGNGVNLIGDWFGIGAGRGIALVFMVAGIIGLIVTVIAMRLPAYKLLAKIYIKK